VDLTPQRKSIEATYDSRETGPRFHVTTRIDDRTITFQQPIDDPFVRTTVRVSLLELLRGVLRRGLTVEVITGGHPDVVNDVLELDDNTLIPGSTRRQEFGEYLGDAIKFHIRAEEG
jgi:hypothetical protein